METFKTIRKIILIISGIAGAGVFIFYVIELIPRLNSLIKYEPSPWKEPLLMLSLCIAQFIFFVIFFKFVLMLIEAVKKDTGKMTQRSKMVSTQVCSLVNSKKATPSRARDCAPGINQSIVDWHRQGWLQRSPQFGKQGQDD